MSQPVSSPQKGLPGFLRRTMRTPLNDSNASSSSWSSNPSNSSSPISAASLTSSVKNNTSPSRRSVKGNSNANIRDENGETGSSTISTSSPSTTSNKRVTATEGKVATPKRSFSLGYGSEAPSSDSKSSLSKDYIEKQQQHQQHGQMTLTRTLSLPSSSTKIKKSYREAEFEKIMVEPVVNVTDLRRLGWNGIPPQHRSEAWKILLGYLPTNSSRRTATLRRKRSEYRDAVLQHHDLPSSSSHLRTPEEQETLRQVLVDVPRTAPDVGVFRNEDVRRGLERLLHVWAVRHPASSYVQGINDLATPLLAVFLSEYCEGAFHRGIGMDGWDQGDDGSKSALERLLENDGGILREFPPQVVLDAEADCYWCLTSLLAGIQDHYTSDQPGVQRMVMRLEELVMRIDAGLAEHLKKCGVEFMQFAFRWMNCLLLREFELKRVIRLWDTYLSEGDGGFESFHVYVCAAFLCQFSDELKAMQFDEIFGFMQNIPTSSWSDGEIEILLSQAYVLSTLFQGSDAHLITPH